MKKQLLFISYMFLLQSYDSRAAQGTEDVAQLKSRRYGGKYTKKDGGGPRIRFSLRGVGTVEVFGQKPDGTTSSKGVLDGAAESVAVAMSFQPNETIILKPVAQPAQSFTLRKRSSMKKGQKGYGKRVGAWTGKQQGTKGGAGSIVCSGGVCRKVTGR